MTLQLKVGEFAREAFQIPQEIVLDEIKQKLLEPTDGISCFMLGCEYAFNNVLQLLKDNKFDVRI